MITINTKWAVTYYNKSVERAIQELPIKIRARYFALTDRMEMIDPDLGMPHTKAMRNGLFELRIKAQEGIARALYCVVTGNEIVVLSCFVKKTQLTPKYELEIAKKRLKEVKKND